MKTNWLIIMLLAGVTANAQVYIGSNPNGRPSPGVALEVESTNMGIQFPVVELDVNESLETIFPNATANLPEGSMVYVKLKNGYNNSTLDETSKYKTNKDGFYVKTSGVIYDPNESYFLDSNSMSWEFSGVVSEKFVNNQVVNDFLGYPTKPFTFYESNTINYNSLKASEYGYDFQFCKKNIETSHTYCVFKDTTNDNTNNGWLSAYNLAKSKGGYLLTITNQAEYEYVFENVFGFSGSVFNSSTNSTSILDLSSQNFKTWMGFTTYNMEEFKNGNANKTDSTPSYDRSTNVTTTNIGNVKYLFITGEEFLMDWESSTQTGANVETNSYYDKDTFKVDEANASLIHRSSYFEHKSEHNLNSLKTIGSATLNGVKTINGQSTDISSDFKYVIVEYTN